MTRDALVVVRGGGDLGTGVTHRLVSAGYRVVVLECEAPRAVRRTVAFAEAVHSGEAEVEGVRAVLVDPAAVDSGDGSRGMVPVVVDPEGKLIATLAPDVVVDARMAKRNLGTARDDATLTVGLGPGFEAGLDVDLVIETKRGHSLGRVIESGPALPDTGVPGEVGGASADRLLRAPAGGEFHASRRIGDSVAAGDEVGRVGDAPVTARVSGLIRGLAADGLSVKNGDKLGDVDPRGTSIDPRAISDKARAVGGAALEALLSRGMLPR
jgi:xanthine dehydrogenase accessory factor